MNAEARITLRFDGGSRGNPGPAAAAFVLETDDGTPIASLGRFIGQATNNVAEYKALVFGLEEARRLGVKRLRVLGDSELVIKQIKGEYKVRNESLRPLFEQAQGLLRGFALPEVGHNKRGHNTLADALANLAMDRKANVTEEDLASGGVGGGMDIESDVGEDVGPGQRGGGEIHECPRCGCRVEVVAKGEPPAVARPFICRCGTPMRGVEG